MRRIAFFVRPLCGAVEDVVGADRQELDAVVAREARHLIDGTRVHRERALRYFFAAIDVMECGTVDHQVGTAAFDRRGNRARIFDVDVGVRRRVDRPVGPPPANLRAELPVAAEQQSAHRLIRCTRGAAARAKALPQQRDRDGEARYRHSDVPARHDLRERGDAAASRQQRPRRSGDEWHSERQSMRRDAVVRQQIDDRQQHHRDAVADEQRTRAVERRARTARAAYCTPEQLRRRGCSRRPSPRAVRRQQQAPGACVRRDVAVGHLRQQHHRNEPDAVQHDLAAQRRGGVQAGFGRRNAVLDDDHVDRCRPASSRSSSPPPAPGLPRCASNRSEWHRRRGTVSPHTAYEAGARRDPPARSDEERAKDARPSANPASAERDERRDANHAVGASDQAKEPKGLRPLRHRAPNARKQQERRDRAGHRHAPDRHVDERGDRRGQQGAAERSRRCRSRRTNGQVGNSRQMWPRRAARRTRPKSAR